MIKTILVPLTGLPSDEPALESAYRMARLFDAHLECLHVRPDAFEMARSTTAIDGGVSVTTPEIWKALQEEAQTRSAAARKSFDAFGKRYDIATIDKPAPSRRVSAQWCELEGNPNRKMLARARYNDLVVFGRGSTSFDPIIDDVGEVLVGSGRPVLIAPKQPLATVATTVAIAWKETAEAARALTAAMPLLMKAQKILIFAAAEGLATDAIEAAERLASALRWHGLAPDVHCVIPEASGAPDAVLKTAHQHKVDFLVMGAYGHSRVREFVFGGFTRHMLQKANVPVFLFH